MTVELGGILTGLAAAAGVVWTIIRQQRHEQRTDAWLEADGALAKANEKVDATITAHRDYVHANAQERQEMEDALSAERRRRAELESQLVELKAELAKKQIELAEQIHQVARLEHRVDQLIAGNGTPLVDTRPPHLDRQED